MAFEKHLFIEGGKTYMVNLPANSEVGRAFDRMAEKFFRTEAMFKQVIELEEALKQEEENHE